MRFAPRQRRAEIGLMGAGAASLVALSVRLRDYLDELAANPDIASSYVIAGLVDDAPAGRVVTLGDYPWYEPLLFMRATEWLPAHRRVWEVAPLLFSAAAIAGALAVTWRTWGRWPALVAGVLLVSTTEASRFVMLSPNAHGAAFVHTLVLGSSLVVVVSKVTMLSTAKVVLAGALLAAFTAPGTTDKLLVASGLLPFAIAGLASAMLLAGELRARLVLFTAVTMVGALLGGIGLRSLMEHDRIVPSSYGIGFPGLDGAGHNLGLFVHAFSRLGAADILDPPEDADLLILAGGLSLAGLAAAALGLVAHAASRRVRQLDPARRTYIVVWGAALVTSFVAFVGSSAPRDATSSRYLLVASAATALLLPVLTCRLRTRTVLAAGVTVYATLVLAGSLARPASGETVTRTSAALERFLVANGATTGYADYSIAPVLTWASDGRVRAYAVSTCGAGMCPFYLHTVSSWYRATPVTQERTFLVVAPGSSGFRPLSAVPAGLGRPVASREIDGFEVLVYDGDLGRHLS